jgi:hypothetical protein
MKPYLPPWFMKKLEQLLEEEYLRGKEDGRREYKKKDVHSQTKTATGKVV